MILKKLTLYNYRAFSGINVFELDNKKNKPLTVFEAQNSHGKTTFYRAIHWCLFGNESSIQGESTGIANRGAVRKSQLYSHTTYSVEIEIETIDKKSITFKRVEGVQKFQDNPSRSKFLKDKKEFIVKYYDHARGGHQEKNDEFIYKREVENVIPEKISPFCFFDGEELKRLLNDYKSISKKIKEHLELVTYLDSSEQTSKNLQRWIDDLLSASSGNDEMGRKLQEYSRQIIIAKQKKDELNTKIEEASQSIKDKEKEFSIVSKQFRDSEKTKDLEKELKRIENDIAICSTNIDRMQSKYEKKILDQFDALIIQEPLINMNKEIEKREEEGNFPPAEVKPETVKQLISDDSLIIPGDNFTKKDVIAGKIKWSKSFSKNSFIDSLDKFNEQVVDAKKGNLVLRAARARNQSEVARTFNYKELDTKIKSIAKDIAGEEEKRDSLIKKKKKMETNAIKQSPGTYEKILTQRSKVNSELMSARSNRDGFKGELKAAESTIAHNTREHTKIRRVYDKKTTNMDKVNFVKLSKAILDQANDMILDQVLVIVNKYFQEYLDTILHSKNEFVGRIDNDFNMIVENEDKLNVLLPENREEASAGQRNIIAYSYMLAINKAAGLSFPIMIDTPAGRLDSEHKINTYTKLVETFNSASNLNQLLLLVQDSELNVKPQFKDIIRKEIIPKYTSNYFNVIKDSKSKNSSAKKVI